MLFTNTQSIWWIPMGLCVGVVGDCRMTMILCSAARALPTIIADGIGVNDHIVILEKIVCETWESIESIKWLSSNSTYLPIYFYILR